MSKAQKKTEQLKHASSELEKALQEFEKLKTVANDPFKQRESDFKKKIAEIQKKIDYLS